MADDNEDLVVNVLAPVGQQLKIHLQVLLLVGLIVFCLSLLLGCFMCWKKSDIWTTIPKSFTSTQTCAETSTSAQEMHLQREASGPRLVLDGETPEYPSTFTSPALSERERSPRVFSDRTQPDSDEDEQTASRFSLRRFSSPLQTAPLYKPIHPSRASLPSLPKLGTLTRTCKAMQRRCTVAGDYRASSERSKLIRINNSHLIPLAPLSYGSSASRNKPFLHFTAAFSPDQQTLTVTVLNLTGGPQRLEDVTVLGSLPPLRTCPTRSSFSPESNSLVLILKVSSLDELKTCELRLNLMVTEAVALGGVVVRCGERDWRSENPLHFMKELINVENVPVSVL
ncbi:uncharacterized protein syt18b isoform X2 [Poecilia reticulata]|uniref:uncharacterized protein syt18b isoform X2 n=1 Tax=Poecilia reticulata TaxID=8081 RepID=UPI0007EB848A|nr:PREDICTED: uncharacterized protein LOC103466415 isoform X2 [Poecilia reticulata]